MSQHDQNGKARADRLRERIRQIKDAPAASTDRRRPPSVRDVNPREFIHHRMHELDRTRRAEKDKTEKNKK